MHVRGCQPRASQALRVCEPPAGCVPRCDVLERIRGCALPGNRQPRLQAALRAAGGASRGRLRAVGALKLIQPPAARASHIGRADAEPSHDRGSSVWETRVLPLSPRTSVLALGVLAVGRSGARVGVGGKRSLPRLLRGAFQRCC